MREPLSANAWRAAALALAVGWGVMACGGGGDAPADTARVTMVAALPAPAAAAAASQPEATPPCAAPRRAAPAGRPSDTAALEREFSEEMREIASGVALGAGSVDVADPFADR